MEKQPKGASPLECKDIEVGRKTGQQRDRGLGEQRQGAALQRPEGWAEDCHWFSPILAHTLHPVSFFISSAWFFSWNGLLFFKEEIMCVAFSVSHSSLKLLESNPEGRSPGESMCMGLRNDTTSSRKDTPKK